MRGAPSRHWVASEAPRCPGGAMGEGAPVGLKGGCFGRNVARVGSKWAYDASAPPPVSPPPPARAPPPLDLYLTNGEPITEIEDVVMKDTAPIRANEDGYVTRNVTYE